jgi:transposase
MSDEAVESANEGDEDRSAAYQEAAVELAKGIALGAVPFLGQAIDAYDTIESSIVLYNAESTDGKEDAQFDLLMAVIGWVPGPGDGLKKSLRIVNKDPQRYAPVLFDLLRFVLQECGIKTSPEELLKQIFDAGKLRAELDEIITGVKGSSTFQSLPNWAKTSVVTVLAASRDNMPAMVGIVEKRLVKWKGMQRNSSAASSGSSHPKRVEKPASKDSAVAAKGTDGASGTHSNQVEASNVGLQAPSGILNEGLGVSGEHIADYICAEDFGWGKDWDGYDKGADGKWLEGVPSASKMGKLSRGGSPKAHHVLYKLTDGANGTGIDAVWRANPATNNGKKFAIVEAKASRDEDGPKFLRKPNNTRKPGVTSKLGVSGVTDPSDLLEPLEPEQNASTGKKKAKSAKYKNPSVPSDKKNKTSAKSARPILVQMSKEWIRKNIPNAVSERLTDQVLGSYSRHLFYAPLYHPEQSPKEHAVARLNNGDEKTHTSHSAFHYAESEIKSFVNKRKKSLASRHGTLPSLTIE